MRILALIVLLCPALALGQTHESPGTSGNAFLRLCSGVEKENVDLEWPMACLGYVSGFIEGVDFGSKFSAYKSGRKPSEPYCIPENVENGQLVSVILKYIRDQPEKAHLRTGTLIVFAFEKAYPCPSR
jgi:hypothetical protein